MVTFPRRVILLASKKEKPQAVHELLPCIATARSASESRTFVLPTFQWMAVKNPFAVVEQVWMPHSVDFEKSVHMHQKSTNSKSMKVPGQHPACRWDMHSLGLGKMQTLASNWLKYQKRTKD